MRIEPIQTQPTFGYNHPLKSLYKSGQLNLKYGFYGGKLTRKNVTLEHLKPHSKGGKTELNNYLKLYCHFFAKTVKSIPLLISNGNPIPCICTITIVSTVKTA